jgi:hypothetical protein
LAAAGSCAPDLFLARHMVPKWTASKSCVHSTSEWVVANCQPKLDAVLPGLEAAKCRLSLWYVTAFGSKLHAKARQQRLCLGTDTGGFAC